MEKVSEYISELSTAIRFFNNAVTNGKELLVRYGDDNTADITRDVLKRPLVGFGHRVDEILDELCNNGREQITFNLDRLKDKGLDQIFADVAELDEKVMPDVGGRYEMELTALRQRIKEMAECFYFAVCRAQILCGVNHTDKDLGRDKGQYSDYMVKVFKGDVSLIRLFSERIKNANPSQIVYELRALLELGLIIDNPYDKYKYIRKPMYDELATNYNVGSNANWNKAINKEKTEIIQALKECYLKELKKGQS